MLAFSQSAQLLKSDLYQQQLLLESFADLSIFDSTVDKDRYLASAIEFMLETSIDSANGCVLVNNLASDMPQITYSSIYNAVLACWLLSAAKALCNGDLSHYGKLMIEALDRNMWDPDSDGFVKQKDYSINSPPFYIQVETLSYILSEEETKLLGAYVDSQLVEPRGYVCLHFRCLLNEAAQRAEMSIKQAQVVDASLRQKIKALNQEHYMQEKGEIADKAEQLTILSCMTQALLWYPREIAFSHYQLLKNKACEYLENSNEYSTELQIQLYSALAETMQLEYNEALLTKTYEKSLSVKWETELTRLSPYSRVQLFKLYRLFLALGLIDKFPEQIRALHKFKEVKHFSIKRLDKNIQLNEETKQVFFEKYRISQLLI